MADNTTIEYEIKSEATDTVVKELTDGLALESESIVADVYYDVPEFKLFRVGAFLRLRNGSVFETKYNEDLADSRHLSCKEGVYPTPLSDQSVKALDEFLGTFANIAPLTGAGDYLKSRHLQPIVTLVKRRRNYIRNDVTISVDHVDDLGLFIELEATGPESISSVSDLASQYHLRNCPVGYVEMYLRKHNHGLYKQGRYLLAEDVE